MGNRGVQNALEYATQVTELNQELNQILNSINNDKYIPWLVVGMFMFFLIGYLISWRQTNLYKSEVARLEEKDRQRKTEEERILKYELHNHKDSTEFRKVVFRYFKKSEPNDSRTIALTVAKYWLPDVTNGIYVTSDVGRLFNRARKTIAEKKDTVRDNIRVTNWCYASSIESAGVLWEPEEQKTIQIDIQESKATDEILSEQNEIDYQAVAQNLAYHGAM